MTGTIDDAHRPPWPWRGVAWVVSLGSLLMAWGAIQRVSQPDLLIVDFFAAPGVRNAIMALWALLLANAVPVVALLMGLRFWSRERETPEYRSQALLIVLLAVSSCAVITVCTIRAARALSGHDTSVAFADHSASKPKPNLEEIAQSLNVNMPIEFNDGTRVLGVLALDERLHFQYQYSIVGADEINPAVLREEAQAQSLRAACSDPDMRALLSAGVSITKTYVDKDHVHLATYEIAEADCDALTRDTSDERSNEAADTTAAKMAGLAVAMANAGLPAGTVVQEGLISEGAEARGEEIVYSYRLTLPKERIDGQWIQDVSLRLPRDYCDKLEAFAKAGISAEWRYVDSRGELVLSVRRHPDDCAGG